MHTLNRTKSRIAAIAVAVAMLFTCVSFADGGSDAYATSTKAPYTSGDDISDAVFYIAVDADGNGKVTDEADAIYYYTYQEIKDVNEEVAYHYGNHGQGETANVKGAKLSTLLDNITGVTIESDWVVQYMEEDAYHATDSKYQDTVQGLTDENGVGNGSGEAMPAETIIGYTNKTTYDDPDENNVNDTDYVDFLDYSREASYVRAYRQTDSANSSVLKLLKGVVVSNNERAKDADGNDIALPTGETGYILKSVNAEGTTIADEYTVQGLLEGMAWPATYDVNVPWATLNDSASKIVTIDGNLSDGTPTTEVAFTFTEKTFFTVYQSNKTKKYVRSSLANNSKASEYPNTNVFDGTEYEFFGYNKPMYVRYQGVALKDLISTTSSDKVYLIKTDGSKMDITKTVDNYFVAYYYTQSKSSTNISNKKRVPLNYEIATVVDTASADIEYSNDLYDYTVISGKGATEYSGAKIAVVSTPSKVTGLKAKATSKSKIKVSWKAAKNAKGYKVYYKKSGSKSWKTKTVSGKSITLKNLSKGKTYAVKVKAYSKSGSIVKYGETSKTVKAKTKKK